MNTYDSMEQAAVQQSLSKSEKPLALYFHIPFCARRCGYCDFNTYTPAELRERKGVPTDAPLLTIGAKASAGEVKEVSAGFTQFLINEFDLLRAKWDIDKPTISSLFIGGGTPTLLAPHQYEVLINHIRAQAFVGEECEITIEANPDTINYEYLRELRLSGINRISFGMQSAVDHVLKTLDRTHDPKNVSLAVHEAKDAGFEEINVDLIYGTPGESMEDWKSSVATALDLPITHISAYALIVEEGTKIARDIDKGLIAEVDDDLTAEKYLYANREFEKAGFHWYELSNWAKDNSYSRHNYSYWESGNWWGIGPGAHSHMNGTRWWNLKFPARYQEEIAAGKLPSAEEELLSPQMQDREKIMLELRLARGLDITQLSRQLVNSVIAKHGEQLFILEAMQENRLILSEKGRLLADAIIRDLID
jgi:oxygen-independent coproporphyrinogen-3 oxidase